MHGDEAQQQHFWREFMKTDEAQDALKAQYREEYDQEADEYERTVKPQELKDLAEALLDCAREIKHIVAPLLKYEFAQRILHSLLTECRKAQPPANFSERLMTSEVRVYLEKLGEEVRASPNRGKEINDTWWAGMCERMAEANKRDMFDDIQYVDVSGVCALMNQGGLCCDMGKTKWKEANWELALDRYTMGVDMLQNRRARGTENEELLNGMTCRLLRNQAACALKLELWGLCSRACDKVLHFKPADFKALYRKGVSELKRGHVPQAELCFRRVTELVPDSYEEAFVYSAAKRDAEKQLEHIRRKLHAAKSFDKTMVKRGFLEREGLFADKRERDEVDAHAPMDEGLRRHIARKLREAKQRDDTAGPALEETQAAQCVDDAAPSLDVERVRELQAELLEVFESVEVQAELARLAAGSGRSASKYFEQLKDSVEALRAPTLARFGFEGATGQRACERAIAAQLDDALVQANAHKLFGLLTSKSPPDP